MDDFAIEEEDGGEGLVLGRGGDIAFMGEVEEESLDPSTGSGQRFLGAHLAGMAFVVEKNEAAHPVDVSLFGAVGVVLGAQDVTSLIEKFFRQSCLLHGRLML